MGGVGKALRAASVHVGTQARGRTWGVGLWGSIGSGFLAKGKGACIAGSLVRTPC